MEEIVFYGGCTMEKFKKKFKHLLWLLPLLVIVLSVACNDGGDDAPPISAPQPAIVPSVTPGSYTLPLIETTDVHGYMVYVTGNDVYYRLAYIADKVNDIRGRGNAYRKEKLLLLDGGDLYQGTTVSKMQKGKSTYIAYDKMNYDAVCLGNHEFDWGIESMIDSDATLPDYERDGVSVVNSVPVVCANIYQNGSRADIAKDYVIVEKTAVNEDGKEITVKIGVIGFVENYTASVLKSQFKDKGYSIIEEYSIAKDIAVQLESSGQCDATVLLVHGEAASAAEKLGSDSVIDFVLGGHTHVYAEGVTEGGMPYAQGKCYAQSYVYAELDFSVDAAGKISFARVKETAQKDVEGSRTTHVTEDENADDLEPEIIALSDEAVKEAQPALEEVIGYITENAYHNTSGTKYSIDGSGGRASVMSNWICDILARIGGADVGFINSTGVRKYFTLGSASQRNITVADVYEMFPFDNLVYVFNLTYEDLLTVFEYSMTSNGKNLISRVSGIDCEFTKEQKYSVNNKPYTEYAVYAIKKDGVTIWQEGVWTEGWKDRTLKVALGEFLVVTERDDSYSGKKNPFNEWKDTDRLITADLVDNEGAVRVLKEEASANGGHLSLDKAPHFILHE